MYPDISEFSYGYALTEELIHNSGLPIRAAPLFPSLIQEGRAGGGYDVQIPFIGFPLFLQFKLSDCMVRGTAWEAQQGLLNPPFYRMHLRPMKHSQQHQLLLSLESSGELVYYAAPHFHKPAELNDAYLNKRVIDQSVFFKPSDIGALPDDDSHHVAFCTGQPAYLFSKPRRLQEETITRNRFDQDLLEGIEKRKRFNGSRDETARLANQMLEAIMQWSTLFTSTEDAEGSKVIEKLTALEPRFQIAYLTRAFFGCEIILITSKDEP